MLTIKNLSVDVNEIRVLDNFNLEINAGESHAIMGPNGSGKSSLCYALMGHPRYKIIEGSIEFEGRDLLQMNTEDRSKLGIFLGFQYPQEIAGMTMGNFLRQTSNIKNDTSSEGPGHYGPAEYYPVAKAMMQKVGLPESFIGRGINEGFSGGEKKRSELAQLLALTPKLAILDEIDSGLDIDAMRQVAEAIQLAKKESKMGLILITHYQRLLHHVPVDHVHLLIRGKVVKSGGPELVDLVEKEGYKQWK